jgi:N-glycosylase/DNA lyase
MEDTRYQIMMEMMEIPAQDFDLAMTLNSGQVFHWERIGNGFLGTIGNLPMYVEQRGEVLRAKVVAASSRLARNYGQNAHATICHYFALDHRLAEICASFPDDPTMNAAREFCRGLRIIRQPKWECLATFICSSMKQLAHIRQISKALRERFGVALKIELPEARCSEANSYVVHTFPCAERLAKSSESELRKCALGYRTKNLLATARLVDSGEADLKAWSALSDADLRKKLCELPGVGVKIANCMMLFAYARLRAFPIDVWIERVLREHYFPRARKLNTSRLREFSESYFGEHGGYAQQYLFYHARAISRRSGVSAQASKSNGENRNAQPGKLSVASD